jgi:hypothetical protein
MNQCVKCNKCFKRPWMLKRHLERKTPCSPPDIKCNQNVTKMIPKCNQNVTKMYPKCNQNVSKNFNNDNYDKNNVIDTQNNILAIKSNEEKSSINNLKTTINDVKNHNMKDIGEKYICEYCNITFKHLRSIYRHKNELRCKKMPKDEINNILNKRNNKTIVLIKSDPNTLNEYKSNNFSTINNGVINNTLNNTNNTQNITNITNKIELKINPMGKEDISFLTKEDKLRILNRMYNCIPELVKTIHNHPENRNFFLPNTNKNIIACVNNQNEIEYNDYNDVCQQILQDNVERLDELFTELETEVNESIKDRLEKVFKKVEDGKLDKKYLKDIKMYVLNNSKRNKDEINNYIDNIENSICN